MLIAPTTSERKAIKLQRRPRLVNPALPPVPDFVLGAATKPNGKVDGVSNIFTGLGRSKGAKVNFR